MAFSSLTNTHHPTIQLYFFQEELKIIILRHICPREEVNRSKLNSTRSTISNFFSTRPSPCFQNLSSYIRPYLPPFRGGGSRCPSSFRDEESKDPRVLFTRSRLRVSISVTKHDIVPSSSSLPLFTGSPRRLVARRGSTNPGWWRDTAMLGIYYLTLGLSNDPFFAFCVSRRARSSFTVL